MNEQIDIATLKKKSLRGVVALFQQTFLIQVIGFIATLVQAAFFSLSEYGILSVANSTIAILSYFTDIGLAGALIQKKESLTKEDLSTTFTVQQILAIVVVIIGFAIVPFIAPKFQFNSGGIRLYEVLLLSFFISSFKTIPAILLERKLDFHKLVVPQIIETLVYNIIVTVLAIKGFGLYSIMWAALARSIVGLVAVFYLSPWRISLGINHSSLKKLFEFGIPFQTNSFIGMAKDDLLMVFLATILTPQFMGIIGFAKKLSDLPLRTIMDSVTRVTFPAFSRMQNDLAVLRKGLEYTTFGIASLVFPIYISAVFFARPLIMLIPRYNKWEPSLTSFYLLAITAIIASFSTPLVNGISAIGKIKITTVFMVIWLVLTWIFVVPLVRMIGYNGFALGLVFVSFSSIMVIKVMQRYIPFSFVANIRNPFLGSLCMALWYGLILPRIVPSFLILVVVGIVGMIIYSFMMWFFEKGHIVEIGKGFISK